MANTYGKVIVLDTYTSAIDINSSLGFTTDTPLFVNSIEWVTATSTHTALISDNAGNPVFSETCGVTNTPIVKYFYGKAIDNLKIAISGVGSGKIIIILQ